MKRGTTPSIKISHTLTMANVSKVDFLFKQEKSEFAPGLVTKTYPGSVTESGGVFTIPFTEAETRLFKPMKSFYCDPKVTLTDGSIPETAIIKLYCSPTLWGENDA